MQFNAFITRADSFWGSNPENYSIIALLAPFVAYTPTSWSVVAC